MKKKIKHNLSVYIFLAAAILIFWNPTKSLAAVSLSVTPASQSVANGQIFNVDVMLNTGNDAIDGVDLFYLRYDPNILQVQDSSVSVIGVQISPENLLPVTLINTANNSNGTIQFSQVSSGGTTYQGSGKLATISFRAIANGNSNVSIDFSPGGTADSNVAGSGTEKLSSVSSASVAVSAPVIVLPLPIITISLSASAINSGQSSTLFWNSSNSTGCTATDGWSGAQATSGSLLVSPIKDTTYSLACTGTGGIDTKSVTLSVALPGGIPAVSLRINPKTITLGEPATITWSVINATSCTASRGWSGTQALSGSLVVSPTVNTTYSLKCTGINGSKSSSYSIRVNSVINPIAIPTPVIPVFIPNTPTPTLPTPTTGYVLTQNLFMGSRNVQVKTLQTILIALGYNIGGSPTGYFGPKTQLAVRAFQSSKGIVSSGSSHGLVGPSTRISLLTAVSSGASSSIQTPLVSVTATPSVAKKPITVLVTSSALTQTLYRGLTSPQVVTLQNILVKLGYSIGGPATGYYGVKTEDAVKAFQRSKGIASYYGDSINTGYGIVGPATRTALIQAVLSR